VKSLGFSVKLKKENGVKPLYAHVKSLTISMVPFFVQIGALIYKSISILFCVLPSCHDEICTKRNRNKPDKNDTNASKIISNPNRKIKA
jgi:hypothetical protein